MGIRPSVSLCVAVTDLMYDHKTEKIIDPRWKWHGSQYDWQDEPVPIPTKEQYDVAYAAFFDAPDRDTRPAHVNEKLWDQMETISQAKDFEGEKLSDVLYWADEYALPNVVAHPIAELPYDNYCLWAMSEIWPEVNEIKFIELPLIAPSQDYSEEARWWGIAQAMHRGTCEMKQLPDYAMNMVRAYQRRLDNGWNYTRFGFEMPIYARAALYLMREGLKLMVRDESELRLGIYWRWS